MKVIFVLHSHTAGGAERHLLQLMQGLSASGITCIYAGPVDGWLGHQLIAAGFQCEDISFTGLFDALSLFRLCRFARREKADILHGHLTRSAYYTGWASQLTGIPSIATAHSTNAGKWFGRAKRIIAVAEAVKRFLVECGYPAEIVRTVRNGIPDLAKETHESNESMRRILQLSDAPVLSMVARFLPAKGQDIAIKGLARIKHLPWTLVLTGAADNTYAKEMQSLAKEFGMENRIRFIGHRDDVANIYACTDILLAPSRREAFSLTLLEASAFRVPIVAADVGGISEAVINGETGLLVEAENPEALANAVATLLDNAELRKKMGETGRQRYETRFSLDQMTNATIAVYREVVGKNA